MIRRPPRSPLFPSTTLFRSARACRDAGLESLAEEMRLGAVKAMHTLDVRESRSSLAGVMMAAAMEGIGIYEFSKHVIDRKSTRLNSSHANISYAVFCLTNNT